MIINDKQIKPILAQIYNEIIKYKGNDVSLLSGKTGNILFLIYYSKYIKKQKNKLITDLFSEVLNKIQDKPIYTFCSGLAGIGWTIEHLVKNNFLEADTDDILEDINDFLYKFLINDIRNGHYDFLHGATGIALYFLNCKSSTLIDKYIYDYIDELFIIAEKEKDESIKWVSTLNGSKGRKVYDLGLAHGIASLIVILSKIYKRNINQDKTNILLLGAVKYLLKSELNIKQFISHFPYSVTEKGPLHSSRLAWCYGDLGIAAALYQAAIATNNEKWEEKAIEVFIHSTKRKDLIENLVQDAGLCHGTAGIAHIYNRMYQNTKIELFKKTSNFWFNETLKMAKFEDGLAGYKKHHFENSEFIWVNEYGVLEGIAGIGLAMISAISDEEPKWDECLLLS